jgi:hypothetical protein
VKKLVSKFAFRMQPAALHRGPAPLSLALAHLTVSETDTITFSPWTETDFRTGLNPWWK